MEQLEEYTISQIRSLEMWMRRVISYAEQKELYSTSNAYDTIKNRAEETMAADPDRFARWVDALFFHEEITLTLYVREIRDTDIPFTKFLKSNKDDLNRVRNQLFHRNPVGEEWLHGMLFFSKKLIENIQKYFMDEGRDREFNVPIITRAWDSWGREVNRPPMATLPMKSIFAGDVAKIWVEVDASFPIDSYRLRWFIKVQGGGAREILGNETYLEYEFKIQDIGSHASIFCEVIQNKSWHRWGRYDDRIQFSFKVLPRQED